MPKVGYKQSEKHRMANNGKKPWNKGKKLDRKKYPKAGHTQKHSDETKKKMSLKATGRKYSKERNNKISEAKKGKLPKFIPSHKGIKHTNYSKKKISDTKLNGRLPKEGRKHMYSYRYKIWMREVKNRDNWKCKINNKDCCGKVEAHHILTWNKFPELRYNINNGITLCHHHHPKKREDEERLRDKFKKLIGLNNN